MRRGIFLSVALLGGLITVYLFSGFYTLNEGELGLMLRNGKVCHEIGPGPGWKLPGIDTIFRISSKNNLLRIPSVNNYTADNYAFNVSVSVAWHVAPEKVADIYTQYNDIQSVELTLIRPRILAEVGLIMSRYKGHQLFQPNQFIKDVSSSVRLAVGELVIIDSLSFEQIKLANRDSSTLPAVAVQDHAG